MARFVYRVACLRYGRRAIFFAGAVKINHAEHRAMIGDRQRGLSHIDRVIDQPVNLAQPVKQAEFGMDVKMDEIVLLVRHKTSYSVDSNHSVPANEE